MRTNVVIVGGGPSGLLLSHKIFPLNPVKSAITWDRFLLCCKKRIY